VRGTRGHGVLQTPLRLTGVPELKEDHGWDRTRVLVAVGMVILAAAVITLAVLALQRVY
jgi:hypothetical protein